MILVDATGISASRPGKPLFEDLSVTVSSGDRLGVVGINGGGKSTLLGVLAGTRAAEAGDLRRGRGIRVSVLDQDAPLPAGTVAEVVGGAWEGAAVLDRLGMGAALDTPVDQLSGGQVTRGDQAVAEEPLGPRIVHAPLRYRDWSASSATDMAATRRRSSCGSWIVTT